MTDSTELVISPLAVPESLDAPDAAAFLAMVRIGNDVCRHDAGHDYLDQNPEEALGFWQDETDWLHIGFVARRGDRIVGVATMTMSTQPDSTTTEFEVLVDPDHWGEGVEEALLAQVEREARERHRRTIQAWTLHRPSTGGARLEPSTGWGSIPADDRQTVFQIANGFTLEQVERNSAFDLRGPFDEVEAMLADALATAGEDYRVVTWTSPTPPEHVDAFGYVLSRMSTDAPQGGLVVEEQLWDADRVRRRDARMAAQGLIASVAAVEHVPTETIVAYNELVISADERSGATSQYGTLVLNEHRGHRLGAIVKCANLLRWVALVPESPRVSTFNAEENRHMLDINEAIGFVPVSYAGAWKKTIDA